MKKLLTLMALLILLVYLMPMATLGRADPGRDDIYAPGQAVAVGAGSQSTTAPDPTEPLGSVDTSPQNLISYDMKTYVTVSVGGQPQTLRLHDYLVGVVAAEMPASFPDEALKAQALAARTYTLYKIKLYEDGMDIPADHNGAHLCDDPTHCKAYCDVLNDADRLWGSRQAEYLGKITDAVQATCGLIAVYEGQPIAAVFHAAAGERTEAAVDVWGSAIPYLQSVESRGGEQSSKYLGSVTISQQAFKEAVLARHPEASFSSDPTHWFKASSRSEAGGIIDVAVGGVRMKGTEIRQLVGLNSTNFRVQVSGSDLLFTTQGYGHGVGMSQYGARAMALEGATYGQIIKHYFSGVELLVKS